MTRSNKILLVLSAIFIVVLLGAVMYFSYDKEAGTFSGSRLLKLQMPSDIGRSILGVGALPKFSRSSEVGNLGNPKGILLKEVTLKDKYGRTITGAEDRKVINSKLKVKNTELNFNWNGKINNLAFNLTESRERVRVELICPNDFSRVCGAGTVEFLGGKQYNLDITVYRKPSNW